MAFNKRLSSLNKKAMAKYVRAQRRGGSQAGGIKYYLTSVEQSKHPQMFKNKQSINEHYSGDGGDLHFVFSGENAYDRPVEANDDFMLKRMKMELAAREAFVQSVYWESNPKYSEDDVRNIRLDIDKFKSLLQNHEDPDVRREDIQVPFINPEEGIHGSTINSRAFEIKKAFDKFHKKAGDEEFYQDRGEIDLLTDSINTLSESKDSMYDVNSYIEEKIRGNKDLEDTYRIIKELKLPIQSPSWVEIALPNKSGKSEFGKSKDEVSKISQMEDITFYDQESQRKFDSKLPSTPQGAIFGLVKLRPDVNEVEPEFFRNGILEILSHRMKGTDKYLAKQFARTTTEQLYEMLSSKEKEVHAAKMNVRRSGDSLLEGAIHRLYELEMMTENMTDIPDEIMNKIQMTSERIKLLQYIRDNMNSYPPNHEKSFLRLHDEICNLYFDYNRERYGDAIFLEFNFTKDTGNGMEIHSPARAEKQKNTIKKPFLPSSKAGDMREIIISVQYSRSTPVPQLAKTNLHLVSSRMFDYQNVKEELSRHGIGEVTIDQYGNPQEVPVQNIDDFFSRIINNPNRILVYRVDRDNNNIDEETKGEFANLIWYVGLRSFTKKDESQSSRQVYDYDGETIKTIWGYGDPRISQGTTSTKVKITEEDGVVTNSQGGFDSIQEAYQFAKARFGLDYPEHLIYERMAKHIKPINKDFIKVLNDNPETRAEFGELVSELESNINSGYTIITPYTKEVIDDAFKNIEIEILPSDDQSEEIEEQVQQPQIQHRQPVQPTQQFDFYGYEPSEEEVVEANQIYNGVFRDKKYVGLKPDHPYTQHLIDLGYQLGQSPKNPEQLVITQMPEWFNQQRSSLYASSGHKLSKLLKAHGSCKGQKSVQELFEQGILDILNG
jgi:hypothetical protein